MGLYMSEVADPIGDRGLHLFPGFSQQAFVGDNRDQSLPVWGALGGDGNGRDPGGDVSQRYEVTSAVTWIVNDGRVQD